MSQLVGESGRVWALDTQADAIARTKAKLATHGAQNVRLLQASHADILKLLPAEHYGTCSAVMFNLGYLPRGDKQLTTRAATTLEAVRQSCELLKPGGVIAMIAYTGHASGYVETLAIESLLRDNPSLAIGFDVEKPATKLNSNRPRLYVLRKRIVEG